MRPALTSPFVLWFLLLPTFVLAQELSCPDLSTVDVTPNNKKTLVVICLAAEKVIAFLADYKLSHTRKILIVVVDKIIDSRGHAAYGSYDSRLDRIVPPLPRFSKGQSGP